MASGGQNMTTFKAKGLTSIANAVDTSNFIFLKSTTLTADQLGNTVSLSLNAVGVTGAASTNHSLFLNAGVGSGLGTPFQLQIPDSSHLYIYKRWYTSGAWSGWSKMCAGTADTWTTTRTLTIGNKGQSVNGSADVSWTLNDILYNATTIGTNTTWDQVGPSVYYVASNAAFTGTNHPGNNSEQMPYTYGQLIVSRAGTGGVLQVYASHHSSGGATNDGLRYRTGWNSGSWDVWSTLLDDRLWRKYIFANKNIGRSTLTVTDSTWAVTSGTDVFGLSFKDSELKYTSSGGSATASTDSGDWRAWLTCASNANTVELNMRIDGSWQAGKFIGPLQGNADTATKATQDGSGNVITSKYVTVDTAQTITGTKSWGTSGAGGQLNGAATNGGINSIRIGDDVWLGDCNTGGIMGMKSTGANCGFYFYKSDGTAIGQLYSTNSTQLYTNLEVRSSYANAFRLSYGNYGVILRNDGSNFYFLVTNSGGAATGSWNSLRPFYFSLSTGKCTIDGDISGSSGSCTGNAATATKADGLKDGSSTMTSAYNKAGLKYGDYTWLAGWNGFELRAVNKSQFAQASHSHSEKLNQWHAGTGSYNAVLVTHNSTGSDGGRGQCFAFGNGNGNPWFTEIQYGVSYVRTIRLSNGMGSTSFISATQFAIISSSWDGVTVCQSPSSNGAITAVASAGSSYSANGTNYRAWIEGNSVTGAVWNDYAENREVINAIPGQCVYEIGDDTLEPTKERLSHFAGIVSDTWGFSQGETETAKSPIAVAGRVLAYTYRSRNEYKPGDVLCAAPGGTVDIMTREEIQMYPDRIVGTVSCVPDYETWGGGEMADRAPVEVDGRIWVKVK